MLRQEIWDQETNSRLSRGMLVIKKALNPLFWKNLLFIMTEMTPLLFNIIKTFFVGNLSMSPGIQVASGAPQSSYYLKVCFVCQEKAKPNQVRDDVFYLWITFLTQWKVNFLHEL